MKSAKPRKNEKPKRKSIILRLSKTSHALIRSDSTKRVRIQADEGVTVEYVREEK